MKKIANKKAFQDLLMIIIGSGLTALPVKCIYDPLDMVTGGFSGLAIIIKALTSWFSAGGIPLGVTSFILNVPIFIAAYIKKGKEFVGKSFLAMVLLSVWLVIIPPLDLAENDFVIGTILGGCLMGLGIGLVLRANCTTGGTDMLAVLIHSKWKQFSVVRLIQIIDALIEAAENGKEVVVLVELRARFDEANNIEMSHRLEDAGCQILYGLGDYKVHSKLCLITQKKGDSYAYITQIGTGNYNEKTSRLYTDLSLITANQAIGADAAKVFLALQQGETVDEVSELLVAPKCLQNKVLQMMDGQIANKKAGKEAYIGVKINSLTDKVLIDKMIEASQAGVKIDLIVRGICCLRVGIPGVSENISVRSIVGNFLEHSRIFYFYNDGNPEVFMGSADWMPRNLDRRVEIVFPVIEEELKEKALHILHVELEDNVKARVMQPDGTYEKLDKRGKVLINSQEQFCAEAKAAVPDQNPGNNQRLFIPAEPAE